MPGTVNEQVMRNLRCSHNRDGSLRRGWHSVFFEQQRLFCLENAMPVSDAKKTWYEANGERIRAAIRQHYQLNKYELQIGSVTS